MKSFVEQLSALGLLLCVVILLAWPIVGVAQSSMPKPTSGVKQDHSTTPVAPPEARSPKWPAVRAAHLKAHPTCEACGESNTKILNVHHVVPFHVDPSKELDEANLITLCEGSVVNCHLHFGHLRNWKSWNVDVRKDAADWLKKIKNRPMPKERGTK